MVSILAKIAAASLVVRSSSPSGSVALWPAIIATISGLYSGVRPQRLVRRGR
jgi:hypothetical protein